MTQVLTHTATVMGGEATVTVVDGSQDILMGAFGLLDLCERTWSRFLVESDIGRLNLAAGKAVTVSPLTAALVEAMRDGFELTDGDFNPTVLPNLLSVGYRTSLAGGGQQTDLPAYARAFASLDGITLSETSITLPQGMTLDPGGIGKGLAADLVVAAVMNSGALGVMASVAGDVVVAGISPEPGGWRIGVEDPFTEKDHIDFISLNSGAVVTSSQRKKKFDDQHHLINPRTGVSAQTSIQTVTVIARTGARAEALAKSGFMRPAADFLCWLPTLDAAGLIVDADGARLESENWASFH